MFIYIHILSYYKLFLHFNLYLSVMFDSLSLMFIYIHILSYYKVKEQFVVRKDMDVNEHERETIKHYT
jgi:hypothetical protein